MLPLVRDVDKQWKNGWCTYPDGFDENPDIEIMCGGETKKRRAPLPFGARATSSISVSNSHRPK
jgi:hypothetical protein